MKKSSESAPHADFWDLKSDIGATYWRKYSNKNSFKTESYIQFQYRYNSDGLEYPNREFYYTLGKSWNVWTQLPLGRFRFMKSHTT